MTVPKARSLTLAGKGGAAACYQVTRTRIALGACVLACAGRASAVDGEVTSDTTTQFYDVRSPNGTPILLRSRLTTTLGIAAYDLVDRSAEPGQELKPDLTFRARMRYDADFAADPNEETPTQASRFVPGFTRSAVDLMYAYVEGRRFVKGLIGFKLGRQYVTDALGWWSFDGGLLRVTTPAYFAVEGYGGLEVRGGMPLSGSTGRWEADGVWRGDRSGMDPTQYPSFQQADVAPAMGFALETTGVSWLHRQALVSARLQHR